MTAASTTTTNAARAHTLARALQAGVAGDRSTLEELCTEDVTAWTPAFSTSSITELVAVLEHRDDAFSDHQLEVVPLDTGGPFAVAEWTLTMTHTGTLDLTEDSVVEPTGTEVVVHGVTVAEFRDERICSVRQYWDELAMFEQLGLVGEGSLTG